MKLSKLFPISRRGKIKGRCVLCTEETEEGLKVDFSSSFQSWNVLYEGNCLCPHCYELARNQDYRRRSWVATASGVRHYKREELFEILKNPPTPPFGIYITRTGQKQGFLQLIMKTATNRDNFHVAFENDILLIDRKRFIEMSALVERVRERKITKRELTTGKLFAGNFKKLSLDEVQKIKKLAGNPVWELVVYFS